MKDRGGATIAQGLAAPPTGISIEPVDYHGWADCFRVSNGLVEAVIVPAIGRVMQFGLIGAAAVVFWENRTLDGQVHSDASHEWMNFGGDKCWPAPQSDWPGRQGRVWPPPQGFDAQAMECAARENGVTLTSQVDTSYGIRVVRTIELPPGHPSMRIRNEYHKVCGDAVQVAVWTITQMEEPERMGMLTARDPSFAGGLKRLLPGEPAGLMVDAGCACFGRSTREFVKVGSEGGKLAWVGRDCVTRIEVKAQEGAYPDGGCVTEIYTNPDPAKYVELETLGPLTSLQAGEQVESTTVYTVKRRTTKDAEDEVRMALGVD